MPNKTTPALPAAPVVIEYFWNETGIAYLTAQGFIAMLGNPKAGDKVTDTQKAIMKAAGGIEEAAKNGLVDQKP